MWVLEHSGSSVFSDITAMSSFVWMFLHMWDCVIESHNMHQGLSDESDKHFMCYICIYINMCLYVYIHTHTHIYVEYYMGTSAWSISSQFWIRADSAICFNQQSVAKSDAVPVQGRKFKTIWQFIRKLVAMLSQQLWDYYA